MPLLAFWAASREQVLQLSAEQILSASGDGRLRDGTQCSAELRQFFAEIPTEKLNEYAEQCLQQPFESSGLLLQDIVNEIGRRLGFQVENGLYRGRPNLIGFDGIWRHQGETDVIVEVETTDYFSVNLEKLNGYRERLVAQGAASKSASFLIVVGREDTNSLEAQIRGSRYAWDMRLISVDALIRSVQVNEKSDDIDTLRKLRQMLRPFEYTRVDKIIELVFATAQEVEHSQELQVPEALAVGGTVDVPTGDRTEYLIDRTPNEILNSHRDAAVEKFAKDLGVRLTKRGRRLFVDEGSGTAACCLISKRYDSPRQPYWYGFSPKMKEALDSYPRAFVVICAVDSNRAFAVPYEVFRPLLDQLNTSWSNGRLAHWHVQLTTDESHTFITIPRNRTNFDLTPFEYHF